MDIKVIGEGSFSRIVQIKIGDQIRVIKKLEYELSNNIIMLTPKTIRELAFLQYINSDYVIKPINITNTYLYMHNEGNNIYEYIKYLKDNNLRLQWREYKLIFWQITRGIFDIHSKGIIHGDIKPQNILYNSSNKTVKICDFNFATLDDGSIHGKSYTLQYRPLESLLSTYNNKSDIWALACTMWEIFTFNPLFEINRQNLETDVNEYIIRAIINKLGIPPKNLIKKYKLEVYNNYFYTDTYKKTCNNCNKKSNLFNTGLHIFGLQNIGFSDEHFINNNEIHLTNNCNNIEFDINSSSNILQLNALIMKMLSYDVDDRPTSREILNNNFFNEFNISKIPNSPSDNFEIENMTLRLYDYLISNNKCDDEELYKWLIKCVLSRLYLNKELDFYNPPQDILKKNITEKINNINFGIEMQCILQDCSYDLLGALFKSPHYQKIRQYF